MIKLRYSEDIYDFLGMYNVPNSPVNKVLNNLNKKSYTVSSTNISSRVLNHWIKKGVFEASIDGKTYKISIIDRFYLEIVNELRSYNFSIKRLSEIRKSLYNTTSPNEEVIPLMEYAFIRCLSFKLEQTYLVITKNDSSIMGESVLSANQFIDEGFSSFLIINLNKLFSKISKDKERFKAGYNFFGLNSDDKELLLQTNSNDKALKSIEISFEDGFKKGYKIVNIYKDMDKALSKLKEVSYGEIITKKVQGRLCHAVVKESKKF